MSAIISPCGLYRYRLEREVQGGGLTFAYFGINPSTADASIDDATVRKWRGFTERNGGGRFIVGNVFAYRATDVKQLANIIDPVGPDNGRSIQAIMLDADVLVPCWGSSEKIPKNLRHVVIALGHAIRNHAVTNNKPIKTWGLTSSGDPKHPLMLGYSTPLIDWIAP